MQRTCSGERSRWTSSLTPPVVDGWDVYDNSNMSGPMLIASGSAGNSVVVADVIRWKRLENQLP